MRERGHSDLRRLLSPPRQTSRCGRLDCELEENRRFSHVYQSRSPARKENCRHGDVRTWSPPRTREEVEGNRPFSRSYRSPSPVWSERHRSRLIGRECQQHGDVRVRTLPRNREEIEGNWRFSRSHRSRSPFRAEPHRSRQAGSEHQEDGNVRTRSPSRNREGRVTDRRFSILNQPAEPDRLGDRPFNEERGGHLEKLSQFCETLSKKESTFSKFQWDNLLAQDNKPKNASERSGHFDDSCKISGVVSDSGVVPTSLPTENVGPRTHFGYCLDATTRGGNHGLIDGGIGNVSPFGKPVSERFERKRSSLIDPTVDMVEMNDASVAGYHDVERVRVPHSMRREEKDMRDCRIDRGGYGVLFRERENMGSLPMESSCRNMKNARGKTSIVDMIDGNGAVLGDHTRESRMLDNHDCFGESYHYAEGVSVSHSMEQDGRDKKKDCRSDPVEYEFIQDKDVSHLRKTFFSEGTNVGSLPTESPCENARVLRTRTCIVDPIADMIGGNDGALRERTRTIRMPDNHGCLQERYVDVSHVSSWSFEQDDKDEEALVSRNDNMYSEMEEGLDPKNLKSTEDCGFERGDGYRRLTVSYDGLYVSENSPQRVVMGEETGIGVQSEIMREGQLIFDMEASIHDQRSVLSSNWNDFEQMHDVSYEDGEWINPDNEQYSLSENSGLRHLRSGMDEWMIDGTASHEHAYSFNPLPSTDLLPSDNRHPSKSVEPPKSNVKQRLGPLRNVKQRLGPAPNACKSLGAAQRAQRKLPWLKIYEERCLDNYDGTLHIQGLKSSERLKKHAKTEAPKDSDEFMQLVHRAFLKFSKLLNENSANRRKYLEKGGNDNLKCCVCGRFVVYIF
ncbi:unnamed protein product [Dovyalis caffra]|uniref:Uncharacterized protein n=1 Tax=Dovyalis caffra TaxID=77055 RepID=A0AAV1R7G7_9ROSI|nr:unnamed protein product [Dovyalis caffra]